MAHPLFQRLEWISIDPSTKSMSQHGVTGMGEAPRSILELLAECGIYCIPSEATRIGRTQRMLNHFHYLRDEYKPEQRISLFRVFKTCPMLWQELLNLKTPELSGKSVETKSPSETPVKRNDHAFDDATYFLMMHPDPNPEPDMRQLDIQARERRLTEDERWVWDTAFQKIEQRDRAHADAF